MTPKKSIYKAEKINLKQMFVLFCTHRIPLFEILIFGLNRAQSVL